MKYTAPPLDLLYDAEKADEAARRGTCEKLKEQLETVLSAFHLQAHIVTNWYNDFAYLYALELEPGETVKKIRSMREDFELHLGSPVEIVPTEQGYLLLAAKRYHRPVLPLKQLLSDKQISAKLTSNLQIVVGVDLIGHEFVIDLNHVNNLLIAGTTGSGKSTFINTILLNLIYHASPDDVRFIMIDPKKVELKPMNGLPHLIDEVIFDCDKALSALEWAYQKSQARFEAIRSAGCHSLSEYEEKTGKHNPHVFILIDEFMDLMLYDSKRTEQLIHLLSERAATTGIHLFIATQRPTADVISPEIKSNIPCRASFTVVDRRESRFIIDRTGAERLLGLGDMIYSERDEGMSAHVQTAYVSSDEVDNVVSYLRTRAGK